MRLNGWQRWGMLLSIADTLVPVALASKATVTKFGAPYVTALRRVRDGGPAVTARIAVDRRVNRIELGNFGDHQFCRDGVWELLMWAPDIACATRYPARKLSCCCAAATSERRMPISTGPANTGKTGKGGASDER